MEILTIRDNGYGEYRIGGLTRRDLELLFFILEKVGGSPSGPRGRIDRFATALRIADIKPGTDWLESAKGQTDAIYVDEKRFAVCSKCSTKTPAEPPYNPEKGY